MRRKIVLLASAIALVLGSAALAQNLGGNHSQADAVKNALRQADLEDVTVSEDAGKNTITLGGTVHSQAAKVRAGDVAKAAAGNRQIANEVTVEPVGHESRAREVASNLDRGIQDDYKAALLAHNLDKLSIHYKAKNGVLTLTGDVKSAQQRQEATELAKKVPNVHEVVNQLEVRP